MRELKKRKKNRKEKSKRQTGKKIEKIKYCGSKRKEKKTDTEQKNVAGISEQKEKKKKIKK